MTPLELAIKFHEIYERLAPSFGYETRTETREFNPESANGKLMIAVCDEIAAHSFKLPAVAPLSEAELERMWREWATGPVKTVVEFARAIESAVAARYTERIAELMELADRLKLEAQMHAQEARTANSTIAEIYQCVTGKTGEPGNWNGAEPVRKRIAELEASEARLAVALTRYLSYDEYIFKGVRDQPEFLERAVPARAALAARSKA